MRQETSKSRRRNYHAYHVLENQLARNRADQDLKMMRKVNREPHRKAVTAWRLKNYKDIQERQREDA